MNLAHGMVDRGHAVDLVLVKAEGAYLSELSRHVRLIDLKSDRTVTALPRLVTYLRKERPGALLATPGHANIIALWAGKLAGVKTRIVVREAITPSRSEAYHAKRRKTRIISCLTRWSYPLADGIVAVSEGVAEDLSNTYGIRKEKIRTIYNPVVTPDIFTKALAPVPHPWLAEGSPPVIMAAGRMNRQKDHATLMHAFALVRQQHCARLMILGEGAERPRLEALAREMGIESDVSFPGFATNPFAYMARARVFVLSSTFEGLPNVLIQALALGTPVVSTDCPSGPWEILQGGRFGLLVPVADSSAMAGAILHCLRKPTPIVPADALRPFHLDYATEAYLETLLEGTQ